MQINPSTGNEREIRLQGSQPVVEMPKLNFKRLMVELLGSLLHRWWSKVQAGGGCRGCGAGPRAPALRARGG